MKRPNDDICYEILSDRDQAFSDIFFVGVLSTGIFCRPGCPAKLPKFENCRFFDTADQALAGGFRACKRCHPAHPPGQPSPLVRQLINLIEEDPARRWSETDLKARHIDPSTARRQFKARFGLTFTQYARARRLGQAAQTLNQGDRVITAQLDAGYDSPSGFRQAFANTFGKAPANATAAPLWIDWLDTKFGRMIAVCDDSHLFLLEFTHRKNMDRQFQRLQKMQKRAIIPGRTGITDQIEAELKDYFAGRLSRFETPLATSGTAFQKTVWEALQRIPYGQTCSYADLAADIGNEKAVRAVAGSNANNGLAVIIPCHRVIAKDGTLGGYAGGLDFKERLLALERAHKPG